MRSQAASNADLDALERRQTDPNNDPHFDFAMMTKSEALALVKRLREAERFLAERGEMLSNQEQLVRQLERVREAAYEVHDTARYVEDSGEPWRVDTENFEALIAALNNEAASAK